MTEPPGVRRGFAEFADMAGVIVGAALGLFALVLLLIAVGL